VRSINFYKSKAALIHRNATLLQARSIPRDFAGLTALPGVGPKIAVLMQTVVFGDQHAGIVVDSNLQRVAHRIGWSEHGDAEKTRQSLQAVVPRDVWVGFSLDVIAFGQVVCKPRNPDCQICPIKSDCAYFSSQNDCPPSIEDDRKQKDVAKHKTFTQKSVVDIEVAHTGASAWET